MISKKDEEQLLKDQQGKCWKCGNDLYQTGYSKHHAVYTRDIRFAKWLDTIENFILVCPKCDHFHGWLSKHETRKKVYKWKIEHGYNMQAWELNIPFVIHDIFD